MTAVAIDESACRRGHDYLTIAADADERKVVFVTKGRNATTIARFAEHLVHCFQIAEPPKPPVFVQ